MRVLKTFCGTILFIVAIFGCNSDESVKQETAQSSMIDKHRPQLHFTPATGWMNDPNGMVYYDGLYHLFFQHYPDSTIWGPMHWGHATSKDLVHWKEEAIALYPDSLGWIFSGSAVYDSLNSSGLGKDGKGPLVAIFTHHNEPRAKENGKDFQYQSLAYSNDGGVSWTKYEANPVLRDTSGTDFRDPKVSWMAENKKWYMTLAVKDHIRFYSSPDLKNWTYESSFGVDKGAHGGVWECPDLISIKSGGKQQWVLIVNINPGGPNGGSGTQYFVGDFDGKTFTASHTDTRWMDYGTDNYAGVTWSNTGNRTLLIGWMSNWLYANQVPTEAWRSATTVVRELDLNEINGQYYLRSVPVNELLTLSPTGSGSIPENLQLPAKFELKNSRAASQEWVLSNENGQQLKLGYDSSTRNFYIDRTNAGDAKFNDGFAARQTAPRLAKSDSMDITLIVDHSSVELFADGGLTVMTAIFFPDTLYNKLAVQGLDSSAVQQIRYYPMQSIWK